jgi:carbon monoxide dehydrogenase subunit G
MPHPPVIEYQREYQFDLTPPELWDALDQVDQYERWWPWLEEFRLEGEALGAGSVLHAVVSPPLPYRMRLRVELTRWDPSVAIDAVIHGDIEGEACLRVHPTGASSRVDVAWTLEMMQRPMRLASRFAHPLFQWGHDRVVEVTVAGFRRRLEPAP